MARARNPDRLLPTESLRDEWRETAEDLGVDSVSYQRRWSSFWSAILTELQDQGSWEDRDRRLLEEYVEWVRRAEFHKAKAARRPYQEHTESGRVFAHPGFKLEQDARREARIVAEQLLLGEDFSEPEEDDEDHDGPASDA